MTNFILIDPTNHSVLNLETQTLDDALHAAGLNHGEIDHGTVAQGFGIVVYEYGLTNPKTNHYFGLNGQLFNGPAIIYAFDIRGETISCLFELAEILKNEAIGWLDSKDEVERAIKEKKIRRPQITVNGTIFWNWNETLVQ